MSAEKTIVTCPVCKSQLQLGQENNIVIVTAFKEAEDPNKEAVNEDVVTNPEPSLLKKIVSGEDEEGFIHLKRDNNDN